MKRPPGSGLTPQRGVLHAKLAASLLFLLGAGAATGGGCAQESPEGASAGALPDGRGSVRGAAAPEATGEARSALTGATTCLTIQRTGASGSIFDSQIADKASKNFGASTTLNTGEVSGTGRQSLLRFDLSGVVLLPNTQAVVSSAPLKLHAAPLGASAPATINAHAITQPWAESTVTWASFGGAFSPAVAASAPSNGGSPTLDIAGLTASWINGAIPNYGVLLEQAGSALTNIWSSEVPDVTQRPTLDVCYSLACSPGFADCDDVPANGCEVPITTVTNCGGCGIVCSFPNAAPACVNGTCQIAACNLGWADCNGLAADGCETSIATNSDCGACGAACALPHASASCGSGSCALTACDAGFFDCDGNPQNGCEPLPCSNGSTCTSGATCQSGVCISGVCSTPACSDGVQNGTETAVDCGGGFCPPCGNGATCATASDCASGVCTAGVCQGSSCSDGVQNGGETGLDCGGACPPCNTGGACVTGSDCQSGVCTGGVCQVATCNDSIQNGAETAIDCGGGSCPACNPGQGCVVATDCQSGVCVTGVCQIPSCTDGVKNGSESDVDCGGACPPCNPAQQCQTSADCNTGVCVNGACQPATCTDGVQNGNETGVDCGGACFVAETCDGIDNDCNGQVDDGLGTVTCGLGACQVTVPACAAGVAQTCVPGTPQVEDCDGLLDEDCDGVVDNGCACVNGATQICYSGSQSTLGVGACHAGTQTCVHGQWGACVGEVTPGAEACNGADDDCNGQVDDGWGPITCGAGACQVTVASCVNGEPQSCTPGTPSAETCDGVDNDCNGQIDDGLAALSCGTGACAAVTPSCVNGVPQTCVPGAPSAEVCDGLDNDCNGVADEGNPGGGQPCNTGLLGVCAAGTTSCSGGQIICVQTTQPSAESCNGLDDDCDGVVDEGNPGAGAPCSTGRSGVCAAGTTVCSGGQLSCQQSQQPGVEVCNGLDDNCDGTVDEGNPGGGAACSTGLLGVCASGTSACTSGAIVCNQNVQPSAEVCDGTLDNDCDGQIDEGCACVNGATQSCYGGGAGTMGVGLCHAGTQTCAGGQWGACVGQVVPGAETCDGLDNDCDGQVDEGLGTVSCGTGACARSVPACAGGQANTCTPGAPSAEVCDGIDNDCDGTVDEGNPGGGAACGTGQPGICGAGTTVCISGALACNQNQPATVESCNGLDDDCDGTVDDGNPGGGAACSTGQLGRCAAGTTTCQSGALACVRNNGPIAETCNNADDNCDGVIDDGNPGAGASCSTGLSGICAAGTTNCSGGATTCTAINTPTTEVCDGLDNDCNGQVDENNVCGTCTGSQGGGTQAGGTVGGNQGNATVSFSNKTTSGNQECASVGRSCSSVTISGSTYNCSSGFSSATGTANCGGYTGFGVTWSNKTTSGAEACAAVGRTCSTSYWSGSNYSCSTGFTSGTGAALCSASASGAGVTWSNKTTSGAQECAAVGRACSTSYWSGSNYSCGTGFTSGTGSALCGAATTSAGVTWSNKTTSGDQECAAVGRTCSASYWSGSSYSCGIGFTSGSGAALCGAPTANAGTTWSNKTTSGAQECAATGRTCVSSYWSGSSYSCNTGFTSGSGAALCGTCQGQGKTWSNKTTSGSAECANVGRACITSYWSGSNYSCGTGFTNGSGAALCGATNGFGVQWSNKTTSGDQECAAVGRTCNTSYWSGSQYSCSTGFTNGSGIALCNAQTGEGATWYNKTTSGNEACAAIGRTCTASYWSGSNYSCGTGFTNGSGAALCALNATGTGATWSNKTTSGNQECAGIGRTCSTSYWSGSNYSCGTGFTNATGTALCALNASGAGVTWSNATTSGDQECAGIGRNCSTSYWSGSNYSCGTGFTNASGNALCGSLVGTGVTWFNQTTSGNAKCAAIGQTCVRAYSSGSNVGCSSTFAFSRGSALCQ